MYSSPPHMFPDPELVPPLLELFRNQVRRFPLVIRHIFSPFYVAHAIPPSSDFRLTLDAAHSFLCHRSFSSSAFRRFPNRFVFVEYHFFCQISHFRQKCRPNRHFFAQRAFRPGLASSEFPSQVARSVFIIPYAKSRNIFWLPLFPFLFDWNSTSIMLQKETYTFILPPPEKLSSFFCTLCQVLKYFYVFVLHLAILHPHLAFFYRHAA